MDFTFEVNFKNMPEIRAIRKHLEREIEKLDQNFEGIESCAVHFDLPYHHRYPGNIYHFEIVVNIPGHIVKVERHPSAEGSSSDIFVLIHQAFEETLRKLDTCASARRAALEQGQQRRPKLTRRPEAGAHF
jgi:ribosome-associated translation inhibitor RaiA